MLIIQVLNKEVHPFKIALGFFILTLFLISSFIFTGQTALAQDLGCPVGGITQITNETDGDSTDTSVSADGRLLAFRSNSSLENNSPGTSQVYLFDSLANQITQFTNFPAGTLTIGPNISPDGSTIAFSSTININNNNPDLGRQLYLIDVASGVITQVTFAPGPIDDTSEMPSLSTDGSIIAFVSDANFTGMNVDSNFEIFLLNTNTNTFTQITDTIGGPNNNSNPKINADGTRIVFARSLQIFLADVTMGTVTPITTNAGLSSRPSINAAGTRIAFESNENFTGMNDDGNTEIFLFDTTTNMYTQITDTVGTDDSEFARISGNGNRIAFESSANLNGENLEGDNEIWLFDISFGQFARVTDQLSPLGESEDPSINFDGSIVGFQSNAEILGPRPSSNEQVYLARCFDLSDFRNVPTLSEWGLIAMAGILGIVGFIAVKRRMANV